MNGYRYITNRIQNKIILQNEKKIIKINLFVNNEIISHQKTICRVLKN